MRRIQQIGQATCCLLADVLLSPLLDEPGEFIGGSVTGYLFHMTDIAWALFAVALVVTLLRQRVAAGIALAGCALWAPIVVYFVSRGVWGLSQILSVLALVATTYVCLRGVLGRAVEAGRALS